MAAEQPVHNIDLIQLVPAETESTKQHLKGKEAQAALTNNVKAFNVWT
jgi:hypothetical protein